MKKLKYPLDYEWVFCYTIDVGSRKTPKSSSKGVGDMPTMTNEQMEMLKELNGMPEFMHNGRLCVEINGNIMAKEAVVKVIMMFA